MPTSSRKALFERRSITLYGAVDSPQRTQRAQRKKVMQLHVHTNLVLRRSSLSRSLSLCSLRSLRLSALSRLTVNPRQTVSRWGWISACMAMALTPKVETSEPSEPLRILCVANYLFGHGTMFYENVNQLPAVAGLGETRMNAVTVN